ncbi:MAG TPA: SPOR domain-containing protein [Burkholderiales bacterium]|jgi:DedD protein|nr:SPOR domain-containing protein [Burkholderiales bacterium]
MATELPEDSQLKRRARRRLIGAIALVLLAVIVLPMIFDAEQKPLDQDVSIQIPSQGDYVAKAPPPGTMPAPSADKKVAPDAPKDAAPADAKAAPVVGPPVTPPAPEVKPEAKAEPVKPAAKAETLPEPKSEPKADAKAAAKAAADKAAEEKKVRAAEAKRAAALLNGGGSAPTSDKSDKVAVADSAFAIQIGAFSSEEKAQEVRDKLSAAGLKSYSEKVATKSGDVTRVRAGPFASKDAAESAKAKIAGLGFASATVVHR